MATDVGPVNVRMTASPKGLAAGLSTAENMVKGSFKQMTSLGEGLSKSIESAFTDPGRFIADKLVGGVAKALRQTPTFGPLLAAPFELAQSSADFLLDRYAEGSKLIKDLGKSAGKTGLDVSDFQLLALAIGAMTYDEIPASEKAIFKLQQNLGAAQLAAEGTRDAFTGLGLSGRELAKLPLSDAFGAVGDKIRELPTASLQAKAAFDLFGKSAFTLLPALLKGSPEIEKMRASLAKFGGGISNADVANVRKAGEASKMIALFKQGITNQLTIATAPFLAELADRIGSLPFGAAGLAGKITEGIEAATLQVATFIDAWESGQFWDQLGASANEFFALVLDGIDRVLGMLPTMTEALSKVPGVLKDIALAPGGAISKNLEGAGFYDWLGGLIAGGGQPFPMGGGAAPKDQNKPGGLISAAADALRKDAYDRMVQIEIWNMWEAFEKGAVTAKDKAIEALNAVNERAKDFSKISGGDPFAGMLPRAQALSERLKSPFEDAINMFKEAKAVGEALAKGGAWKAAGDMIGAVGKHNQFLEMAADGARNPFGDLAAQAGFKALEGLRSAAKLPEVRFAGAMQQGSREAYSLIQAWKANPQLTVEEQMKALLEEARRQREEQIRVGRETLEAFRKLKPEDLAGIGG